MCAFVAVRRVTNACLKKYIEKQKPHKEGRKGCGGGDVRAVVVRVLLFINTFLLVFWGACQPLSWHKPCLLTCVLLSRLIRMFPCPRTFPLRTGSRSFVCFCFCLCVFAVVVFGAKKNKTRFSAVFTKKNNNNHIWPCTVFHLRVVVVVVVFHSWKSSTHDFMHATTPHDSTHDQEEFCFFSFILFE